MAGDTSAIASHGGYAAARNQTFNYAPSPDLIETIVAIAKRPLEELTERQSAEIRDLRDRLGTTDGILHRVAAILAEHLELGGIEFAQLPQLLVELVKRRQVLVEQARDRPGELDPAFAKLQAELEQALAAGDDERASQLLAAKRDAKLAAMKKRREAAEQLNQAATRDLLEAAESEAGLGELANGRLEYRRAAAHFRAAADLLFGK